MSDPFVGEIRMFGYDWAPRGWSQCNGALLPISQNQALFALLGTQFGGNGTTNFALPDLRSRTPMHSDGGYPQGTYGGAEMVTLTAAQMPAHSHTVQATTGGGGSNIIGDNAVFGTSGEQAFHGATNLVAMNPATSTQAGNSQAHGNIQPSLGIGFCIALQGLFPSRN